MCRTAYQSLDLPKSWSFVVMITLSPMTANAYDGPVRHHLVVPSVEIADTKSLVGRSTRIQMKKGRVSVNYSIENFTKVADSRLLFFQLPPVTHHHEYSIGKSSESFSRNPMNFEVSANGLPVVPTLQLRAIRRGVDVTETVTHSGFDALPFGKKFKDSLEKLDETTRKQMDDENLLVGTRAQWAMHATHYWRQNFPAKAFTTIKVEYRPVFGELVDQLIRVGNKLEFVFDGTSIETVCLQEQGKLRVDSYLKPLETDSRLRSYSVEYAVFNLKNIGGAGISGISDLTFEIETDRDDQELGVCGAEFKQVGPRLYRWKERIAYPEGPLTINILTPQER